MFHQDNSSLKRILDIWAPLLYITIFVITYFNFKCIFFGAKLDFTNIKTYLGVFMIIPSCVFTAFSFFIYLYLSMPRFMTFFSVVLVPTIQMTTTFFLQGGKFREINGVIDIIKMFVFFVISFLLIFLYLFYMYPKIVYNKFMIIQALKFFKKNMKTSTKFIILFLLKIYLFIIIINTIEDTLEKNIQKLIIPNYFASFLSLGVIIGTIKVCTALNYFFSLDTGNNVINPITTTLKMIPTIYVNSFMLIRTIIVKYVKPNQDDSHRKGFLKACYKYYNTSIRFIDRNTYGILFKRGDLALYYSLFHNETYFESVNNSDAYMKRNNIRKMIDKKIVYFTLLPTFISFSWSIKNIKFFTVFLEGRWGIIFVPAIITSIILIETINSLFEVMVFMYADNPSFLNDKDNRMFQHLQEISKNNNDNSLIISDEKIGIDEDLDQVSSTN